MKKKLLVLLLAIAAATVGAFALCGCTPSGGNQNNGGGNNHEHVFTDYASNYDATCMRDGTKTAYCTYAGCDKTDTIVDENSKLAHWFNSYTPNNDATCTEDGTQTAFCNYGCNTTDTIPDENSAHGHNMSDYISNNDATCTTDGTKTSVCGFGCGYEETMTDEGSHGHLYSNWFSNNDATCTEDGSISAICDRCLQKVTKIITGSARGHNMSGYIYNWDATCTTDGTKTNYCSNRGCNLSDTIPDEEHPRLGHNFYYYVSDNNATCTEDGTKTSPCGRLDCNEVDTVTDTGSALGHNFINYISDGDVTCTQDGTKTAQCERCTQTDTQVDKAHHVYADGACKFCKTVLKFQLSEDKTYYIVTGCADSDITEIEIPETERGLPVKQISWYAFSDCSQLSSIIIPNSVTAIAGYAFYKCNSLTSITIPDTVTTIGNDAFYGCPIETASIPAIACSEISNINLKTLIVTSGDNILSKAFYNCSNLTDVTISDTVITIGNNAFYGCPIETASIPAIACNEINNINLKTLIVTSGYYIVGQAFYNCSKLTEIKISDTVETMGPEVFYGCPIETASAPAIVCREIINSNLKKLIITSGIIQNHDHYNCNSLTSVTIGDGVTSINASTFAECINLEEIIVSDNNDYYAGKNNCVLSKDGKTLILGGANTIIPDSVTRIESYAFDGRSKLLSITIPDSVTYIGESVFNNCPIETATIPAIACSSLDKNYLKSVNITSGEIGTRAFYSYSNLLSVTIDNGVTNIGVAAFYDCENLTSITIPASVKCIDASAFSSCNGLTHVTICNGVTEIGNGAFANCTKLTSITIPDSVIYIDQGAFSNCSELIQEENGVKYVDKWVIESDHTVANLTLRNDTKGIANYAFYYGGYNSLTNITMGNNLLSIGEFAFFKCEKLISVTIPYSVTNIGVGAFSFCPGIEEIKVDIYNKNYKSENNCLLTKNGKTLLVGCKNSIIPEGVTVIGDRAFDNCSRDLKRITIPDSVISIGNAAFRNCPLLDFYYNGTREDWKSLNKQENWNYAMGKYNVYCTNGILFESSDIGDEVTAEQWRQAFDFTTYDNFSVLTIDHHYSSWNTFSFDGDKVSNIWGTYDGTKTDPFIVSGEIIASKEGETYYYYERSDGEWSKKEIPEQSYYDALQNCRSSIVRPGGSFDQYTFDGTSGKYSYVNPEQGSTEKATVIIKDGKLQIVEYTAPFDYEVTFAAQEYSLQFNHKIDILLPQIEE